MVFGRFNIYIFIRKGKPFSYLFATFVADNNSKF